MTGRKVTCPGCGGFKTERAATCRRCYAPDEGMGAGRRRDAGGALRSIDLELAHQSSWRPGHLPPACGTCHGFGYVQGLEGERSAIVEYRRKVTARPSSRHEPGRRAVAGVGRVERDRGSRAGGWHSCPDCLEHPGSATSHQKWTEGRINAAR